MMDVDEMKGFGDDFKMLPASTDEPRSIKSVGSNIGGNSVVERVCEGKQMGDRLFMATAKLKLFLGCLEALHEAAAPLGAAEPRAVAFSPLGMYITVSVPNEGRVHTLNLPEFFFAAYRCIPSGFRAVIDLQKMIFNINQIYSTYHGRCVEIIDRPDNTLLIHALLDGKRFFDATLETHAVPVYPQPILTAAYYRYPFMIKVATDWMHNIFKRLQHQRSEVIIEFNGETRALEFLSSIEGTVCRQGDIIPADHVLQNPFLPPATAAATTDKKDTNVVYTTTSKVTELPKDRVPLTEIIQSSSLKELSNFRYRSQFVPRAIWLALKRNKISAFMHIFLAPGQPLLLQYMLERSLTDPRRAATYDTWITPCEKQANPHIRMPAGGSAAVAKIMLELAPQLGTHEQTYQIGTTAIQQTTGHTLAVPKPTVPTHIPVVLPANSATDKGLVPKKTSKKKSKKTETSPDEAATKKRGRPPKTTQK